MRTCGSHGSESRLKTIHRFVQHSDGATEKPFTDTPSRPPPRSMRARTTPSSDTNRGRHRCGQSMWTAWPSSCQHFLSSATRCFMPLAVHVFSCVHTDKMPWWLRSPLSQKVQSCGIHLFPKLNMLWPIFTTIWWDLLQAQKKIVSQMHLTCGEEVLEKLSCGNHLFPCKHSNQNWPLDQRCVNWNESWFFA